MSNRKIIGTLAAVAIVVLLVSLVSFPGAIASEETHESVITNAAATPDVRVVINATGDRVGSASVYLDSLLAGTTDSKGNLTLKEVPSAGNHTLKVVKKGLQDTTLTTDFSGKPVVIGMSPTNGKTITMHVTDKNTKEPIANKALYSGQYVLGTTDADGNLVITDYPKGFYMPKLGVDGYKAASVFMVVYSNKTQNVVLTPEETTTEEH
jgi:hypothetical protein